jgi:hypothetical protein
MEDSSVKRLGLILAVQAEIEGMKVENSIFKHSHGIDLYDKEAFQAKAEELRNIACCHESQL